MREGRGSFTLAAVAREVGLTRTAVSLRFPSATDLQRMVMERLVRSLEGKVAAYPIEQGAAGILAFADMIGQLVGGRENHARFVLSVMSNIRDPLARELEARRGNIMRTALAKAMPETVVGKEAAMDAFMAHIMGSLINWQSKTDIDAREFLRDRTIKWLRLAGIPLDGVDAG